MSESAFAIGAFVFLPVVYLVSRLVFHAYFYEKFRFHKSLVATLQREEDSYGSPRSK